jgi:tetratricopeptide (TPR) repeat protein
MRRFLSLSLLTMTILAVSAGVALAQTGQLRGTVKLVGKDGNAAPVAGAQVDVYRTDISGEYHTKSDKKGEWVFAGLPFVGTYVVAVSAPGAQPNAKSGVKAGREIPVDVVLAPGDGRKLTRDEAVAVSAGGGGTTNGGGGGSSETDKAKAAEMAKKNAEIAAENEKIKNANQVISDAFKNGNAALMAKKYDEAIAQYDTGLNADPEHPGAASLLTNKSAALRARAVDKYNAAIQSKDDAAKTAGIEAAKADFKAAAEAANRAVELLNKQPAATDPEAQKQAATNKYFALNSRAEAMRLFVTKVDPTKADDAAVAYQEYIAAETDPAKKAKAQKDFAGMLFESASDAKGYERAMAEYQKILDVNPDDPDALLRMGQSLFNIGAINNNDKATYQQASNYLQHFVDKAPDGQLKTEAKELIEALKAQANVTPEKTTKPATRKRP